MGVDGSILGERRDAQALYMCGGGSAAQSWPLASRHGAIDYTFVPVSSEQNHLVAVNSNFLDRRDAEPLPVKVVAQTLFAMLCAAVMSPRILCRYVLVMLRPIEGLGMH